LKDFTRHCHANHQQAGIYFTPFTAWTHDGNRGVEGTSWRYKDIFFTKRRRCSKRAGATDG
jgi:hypothetical protein